jgi:hypothetical protein
MIVNSKCPNVRIFPYKKTAAATSSASFFMFPGINGSVPDGVADGDAFKEQRQAGLMEVIGVPKGAEGKEIKADETRKNMRPDQIAKAGDSDVVELVLASSEEKAIGLVSDILKEPTLAILRNKETRGTVLSSIEKQIEIIESLNITKKDKAA